MLIKLRCNKSLKFNDNFEMVVARFKNYCIYLYEVDFENLDFLCRFSSVGRATDL